MFNPIVLDVVILSGYIAIANQLCPVFETKYEVQISVIPNL